MLKCFASSADKSIPVIALTENKLKEWVGQQSESRRNWLTNLQYKAKPGSVIYLSDAAGNIEIVLLGMGQNADMWMYGHLAANLPEGYYRLEDGLSSDEYYLAALIWGLGAYQFTTYKKSFNAFNAKLLLDEKKLGKNKDKLFVVLSSSYLIRDLINTPTEDMGPAELAEAAEKVGNEFGAVVKQIIGDELLTEGYPLIHAVGRASEHAPRLIDLTWGNPKHPKLTLVGKGVCFDTGGLDIKPAAGMDLMKKDMAGGAHAIGLARMIMMLNLPVRLRVLVPAVENSVSSDSFRPRDIFASRKGMTVEITNTDAEGRLVLADALAEAATENPDLIIDFSTLTGAGRIALGTDISAVISPQSELAMELQNISFKQLDPIWQLPLYKPYRPILDSSIADITNAGSRGADAGYGGAIVAGLFLQEFVPPEQKWLHFDFMAWNLASRAGRPIGGEAVAVRAVLEYLLSKYT